MKSEFLSLHKTLIIATALSFSVLSCTVTNNLYVNDPFPMTKNDTEFFGGLGMGLKPKIDSVSVSGEVFSNNLTESYLINAGIRYGFTNIFGFAASVHMPEIVGGVGLSFRPQISMFPNLADFNLAFAADLGFVISEDSLRILAITSDLDVKTRGAINAGFSIPFAQKIAKNARLIVTPRYSLNTFYLRRKFDYDRSKRMHVQYPALSLGLRWNSVHLEATVVQYKNVNSFMAGIVYFFDSRVLAENY